MRDTGHVRQQPDSDEDSYHPNSNLHPDRALYDNEPTPPLIPLCEHVAGLEKFIQKAVELRRTTPIGFDLTCDLEDGAPVGNEQEHAERIGRLMAKLFHQRGDSQSGRLGVRIHDLAGDLWRSDLTTVLALAGNLVSYLTVPKIRTVQQLDLVVDLLTRESQSMGLSQPIYLHLLIETHEGLKNVWELAAHPLVETLDFGIMDFISAHRGAISAECMRTPGQFEHALIRRAKTEIVAAALANSAVPSHNVTIEFNNQSIVESDARRAREEFGFLRMWSIHPAQIEPIQRGLSPSQKELSQAIEITLAGHAAKWAPVNLFGILYDRASYRYFWDLLRRAHTGGTRLPDEIQPLFAEKRIS